MRALVLFIAVVATTVSAQSNLPACSGTDVSRWSNCLGTYTFSYGGGYSGEFKDGKFNGQGIRTFTNGNKYVGQFRDGSFNGQGSYTWPNGTKYVGEFRDDSFNGQGIKTYAIGRTSADGRSSQEGIWENDKFVREQLIPDHIAGRTPITIPTAAHAVSNLSAQGNLPDCIGRNVTLWSDCYGTDYHVIGDKYVGEFKSGFRHGLGTYTHANGSPTQEGIWEYNRFVLAQRIPDHIAGRTSSTSPTVALAASPAAQSNLPACTGSNTSRWSNCLGTYTFSYGSEYVGEFKDGKFNGQGIRTFTRSPPQEGIWENNKFVREQRISDHIAGRTSTAAQAVAQVTPPLVRGPSDSYGGRVAARIRPNVVLADPVMGNPRAEVEVRADANGKILSRQLVKSSGNAAWDQAVLRAIDLTGTLPRDTDGRVPPALIIGLRPNDAKPDSVSSIQKSDHIAGRTSSMTRSEVLEASIDFEALIAKRKDNLSACSGSNAARWSNCFGTSSFSNGDRYVGEFRDGKFNGLGSYTAANGNKYVGEFKNGKHSNQGILTFADGSPSKEGIWENGKFLRAQRIPDHIAGLTISTLATVAIAPRQAEPPRSTLALSLTTSQPNAEGVVAINITTNSDTASLKINGDEVGGRADGRYSVNRFAQIGSNSYEVIATDRFGNTSRQTVVVNREVQVVAERTRSLNPTLINAARPRDAVAIIIGIEKYRRVPDADFANRDASAFYDYARRALGIKPENIRLLVDDKADAAEILRAFKTWLPTRVNKNTTDVYVFYSGHGLPSEDGGSLYFLPHEVDRDLLDRTAITQKEVVQTIQRTSPKSVTMFIDSCYSGQSRTGTSLLASARPISIAPKASTDFPSNFMVISASAPDQISSSSPELKHGIFSYYLMLGMEGEADVNKDGQITVGEMQTYLSQQVTRRAIGMNRTQSPQTTGDLSRVLVQASSKTR